MFKVFTGKIINSAFENNIIKSDDIDNYLYGLNAFFTTTVNIISAIVIGMAFNMLFEIVLFIFTYRLLRKYVGGSHAKTPRRCYAVSCITYVCALLLIKYYPLSSPITTIFVIISVCVLYIVSPVEAEKKPLDDVERRVFRKRSYISISICLAVFLVLHYTVYIQYSYYYSIIIAVSMMVVTIFALQGKWSQVKNKINVI